MSRQGFHLIPTKSGKVLEFFNMIQSHEFGSVSILRFTKLDCAAEMIYCSLHSGRSVVITDPSGKHNRERSSLNFTFPSARYRPILRTPVGSAPTFRKSCSPPFALPRESS